MSAPYEPWEDEMIARHQHDKRAIRILQTAMPNRSSASIRYRAQRLGSPLTWPQKWTRDEDAMLRAYYPDFPKLLLLLPHRARQSLKMRAVILGITNPHRRWDDTSREILSKLSQVHTDAEVAVIMGRSRKAIALQRKDLGLSGASPRKKVGTALIEDLFHQADLAGKMLGREARLAKVPRLRRTASNREQATTLMALIGILGGELYAEWED